MGRARARTRCRRPWSGRGGRSGPSRGRSRCRGCRGRTRRKCTSGWAGARTRLHPLTDPCQRFTEVAPSPGRVRTVAGQVDADVVVLVREQGQQRVEAADVVHPAVDAQDAVARRGHTGTIDRGDGGEGMRARGRGHEGTRGQGAWGEGMRARVRGARALGPGCGQERLGALARPGRSHSHTRLTTLGGGTCPEAGRSFGGRA